MFEILNIPDRNQKKRIFSKIVDFLIALEEENLTLTLPLFKTLIFPKGKIKFNIIFHLRDKKDFLYRTKET